ncbi:lipopolysaccharide 1,2-glucosyltransferase [Salmonella enterica subsp. enterica]|uniref:Lipopolysaccharide 1,2-glucosyltransferase n=1 Tax=Salmonella enterica I TaxID=59201 RepID=A0A447P3U1_SALET|nr:lipopolysaccharide 1,2-glucosyltransferase [Salmonella enterica subsp. enterica]
MDSFPEIEIAEYKIFDESNNNGDNVLNISYGVDENYLDGVGVSIASVVLNNNIPLAFHIICDSYSPCFVKIYRAFSRTASHKNFSLSY